MDTELKSCPFCGAKMTITKVGRDWWRIVPTHWHGDECPIYESAMDYSMSISAEDVANIWNTRA